MMPVPAARQREVAPSQSPQDLREAVELRIAELHREDGPPPDREAVARSVRELIDELHAADIAYILEGLPVEDRLWVWGLVEPDREGDVLLEVSDAVRDTLLADMDNAEIVAATQDLDADEIADLAPDLPDEVVQDIIEAQDVEDRAQLQTALSYPEGTVGSLMDFEVVSIREDIDCEAALQYLRRYDELPAQTDALFVLDRDGHLKGSLPLTRLLVTNPEVEVAGLYDSEVTSFTPESDADEAAQSFERYNLICAPVTDPQGKVLGRVTVDSVLEYVRDRQEAHELGKVGLREEEDIFSSVWASAKNRGPWLALNLCTAFVASRVVGAFEGSFA
jgi:magnesium transporter